LTQEDIIPDTSKRLAYWLGIILHPYVVCIPTLFIVLDDLSFIEVIIWTAIVVGTLVIPGAFVSVYFRYQGKYVYQRKTRTPLYIIGWMSLLAGFLLVQLLNGPRVLLICLVALMVWIPIQLIINSRYTKISTHLAVITGCSTGLFMLDKLPHPIYGIGLLIMIALTGWARYQTKNHTLEQIILGILVGGGSVVVVFSILL